MREPGNYGWKTPGTNGQGSGQQKGRYVPKPPRKEYRFHIPVGATREIMFLPQKDKSDAPYCLWEYNIGLHDASRSFSAYRNWDYFETAKDRSEDDFLRTAREKNKEFVKLYYCGNWAVYVFPFEYENKKGEKKTVGPKIEYLSCKERDIGRLMKYKEKYGDLSFRKFELTRTDKGQSSSLGSDILHIGKVEDPRKNLLPPTNFKGQFSIFNWPDFFATKTNDILEREYGSVISEVSKKEENPTFNESIVDDGGSGREVNCDEVPF